LGWVYGNAGWVSLGQKRVGTGSSGGKVGRGERSMLKADILNSTYDCYSQNNNVKMAAV